tara:strand:- start:341 stop:559 length:219 start_codon:yes stop_codon:yes gene_type:complete
MSLARYEVIIGDLGKAIATLVSSLTFEVDVAARERGMKESWAVSFEHTPSNPMDSAQAASSRIPASFAVFSL